MIPHFLEQDYSGFKWINIKRNIIRSLAVEVALDYDKGQTGGRSTALVLQRADLGLTPGMPLTSQVFLG